MGGVILPRVTNPCLSRENVRDKLLSLKKYFFLLKIFMKFFDFYSIHRVFS